MKKAAAVLLIIVIIFGWYASIAGIGDGGGLADRLNLGLDMIGGVSVVLQAQTDVKGAELKALMDQVQAVMERRVNELGLSEPVIAIENEDCIRIELPGAQNAQEAIEVIGKTAQLSFRTADNVVAMDGSHVKTAVSAVYNGQEPALIGTYTINLEFDAEGAAAFEAATRRAVNGEIEASLPGYDARQILIFLDDDVISSPYVQRVISGTQCQITGNFTASTAGNLAALIRGGSLPVALTEIQTDIVGPTLGLDAAKTSAIAGVVGIVIIFIMMIAVYGLAMGLVADISLALYVLIVLWTLVVFHAVLTLPGIAGIILSVGMAVDSNVLIFTRIKEEIGLGKSVRVAVNSGYKRAMTTIIDSQITTIIAAVILYIFGTGSVKGFSLTLLIGIVASLFTAVAVSQLLLSIVAENPKLATAKNFRVKEIKDEAPVQGFDFLGHRRIFYLAAAALIVIGMGLGLIRGFNLGIDFTGGTMMQYNMGKQVDAAQVQDILDDHGIKADIQFGGAGNDKIIIKTTQVISVDERGSLSEDLYDTFGVTTDREQFLEQAGLIGPSVGSELKSNALKAVVIAAAAMLIYVAIRFEWRFGVAAIMALCHDSLMLFALYGLLHIQMNSPFIAGLLIVIGYSINDTIVVFDRIRENMGYANRGKQTALINTSISQSVSRSIMTSLTTVAAVIPLLILCGGTVRAFVLPLIAGVIFGTVSSLCIASALYFDISRLTKKNKYRGA